MKIKQKAIFVLLTFLLLFILISPASKDLEKFLPTIKKGIQIEEKKGNLTPTQNLTEAKNKTLNESNYSAQPQEMPQVEKESKEASKAITLEIFDICSGKLDLLTISEGATKCLNKKFPYQIILQKNSTHLETIFSQGGFSEIYELNESLLIFYLFAEDVASVSYEIQSLSLEGSNDFKLGDYYLHTIWENDASGNLKISKMIIAFPLYVNGNIKASNEWKEIKFYLNIPNKTFYLGNLFVLVKEK
jgi:hypothetical protein